MSKTPETSRVVDPVRLMALALMAFLAWFALQAAQLARFKYFTVDEFQYAHSAWLVAHGQVPYRDFFEVHFPLVYQVLAPLFLIAGDDPAAIAALRLGMLPFLAMAAGAVALLNHREGRVAVLAAPVLMLSWPSFVTLATEIRPDAVAAALFLASLAVLRLPRISERLSGALGGVLLVASAWGSQKAAFYGSIYAFALVTDLAALRRDRDHRPRLLLRSPAAFVSGAAAGLAAIAFYLTATGSWADWWQWCVAWAAEHQRNYPGFSWRRYLDPILTDSFWIFMLAVWGVVTTGRALAARGRDAIHEPDALLMAALGSTFASFALQRAPYPYSFLAFLAVVAVFAARGAGALLGGLRSPMLRAASGVLLVAGLTVQSATLRSFEITSNSAQLEVLARIGSLTAPGDAAYDNSGGYVARPHAYWYFYTDAFLRESIAETLARDVPRAIVESGAVLHLRDLRFDTLPPTVRAFLERQFQPVDGDISLWGQHYVVSAEGKVEETFLASRDDQYFVSPASALAGAVLTIDGAPVHGAVFRLSKGEHRFSYQGTPGDFDILWLPRDGQPWSPRRGLPPTFSRVF